MKDLQKKVLDFVERHNLKHSPEVSVLDLVSEIGEVAKEILKSGDYGKNPPATTAEMKAELGDALYSLITLANSLDIDLEEALNMVLEKYEKRIKKTDSSGNGR
jgi:NTP pyrophosphatase (non-canonical NTP hydrolase)